MPHAGRCHGAAATSGGRGYSAARSLRAAGGHVFWRRVGYDVDVASDDLISFTGDRSIVVRVVATSRLDLLPQGTPGRI